MPSICGSVESTDDSPQPQSLRRSTIPRSSKKQLNYEEDDDNSATTDDNNSTSTYDDDDNDDNDDENMIMDGTITTTKNESALVAVAVPVAEKPLSTSSLLSLNDDDVVLESDDEDNAFWTRNKPSGLTKAKTSDTTVDNNNNKKRKSNTAVVDDDDDREDDVSEEVDNVETQPPSFKSKYTPWTEDQERALLRKQLMYGNDWEKIGSEMIPQRSLYVCKTRHTLLKEGAAVGEDIEGTLLRYYTENPRKLFWTEEDVSTLVEKTNSHRDTYNHIIWNEVGPFFENKTIQQLQNKFRLLERKNLVKASVKKGGKTAQWLPTLIEPTVDKSLDELAFLPTISTLHEYLEIPELYAAVLSPATLKLISKYDHLLYSQDLPLGRTMATRILDTIKKVNTLIEPIAAIDAEGVHYYFGVTGEDDIRARCTNFLFPNNVKTTPKLINVRTKMNLNPRDAKNICDMKSYVLMASPYKQCVLHVEDLCIHEYHDRDGHICLNHGTSAISYKPSPPSKKELEKLPSATGQVIFRLYLTVLQTKTPINDIAVIVGTSPEARNYLPIQKVDVTGQIGSIALQHHTHTQSRDHNNNDRKL